MSDREWVASEPMWSLMNTVRHYPWGSRTVIPELLGEPSPADRPYAELWMGAHPDAPSVLSTGAPLDKAIEEDPVGFLGAAVHEKFGTRLPFLMKVLAADRPLSLQAHPTTEQMAADSFVLALGQETDLSLVEDAPGIDIAEGVVQVGPNMTGHPGARGHGGRRYPRLHQ